MSTLITSWADLQAMSGNLLEDYVLTTNLDKNSVGYAAIGGNWTPIGDAFAMFEGSFDGNGYYISDLVINTPGDDVGLFGFVYYATIQNVKLIKGDNGLIQGRYFVGALVGEASCSNCINCYNDIPVGGNDHVGGIVGSAWNSLIEDSQNHGDITGVIWAGGVLGYGDECLVEGCHNTGLINASTSGGIIGWCDGIVMVHQCYNLGNVEGSGYAGGIVGDSLFTILEITDCYNEGSSSSGSGICSTLSSGSVIHRCYNSGDCPYGLVNTSEGWINNSFSGSVASMGSAGIVGYNALLGLVDNCAWLVNASVDLIGYDEATAGPIDLFSNSTSVNVTGYDIYDVSYFYNPSSSVYTTWTDPPWFWEGSFPTLFSTLISSSSSQSSSSGSSTSISSQSSSSLSSLSSISSKSSSSNSSLSSSSVSSSSQSSFSSQSSSNSSSSSSVSSSSSSSSSVSSSSVSSSSMSSSSISSSSLMKAFCILPFTFDVLDKKPIWYFAQYKDSIYAGTGPNGKVLVSKDGMKWDVFLDVDDNHIKSMIVWSNALFIGTEPKGRIYIYNFVTKKFYQAVQTEDTCVSAFAATDDNLYVGTNPRGIIYQFDRTLWRRLFDAYGRGINAMTTTNDGLYCFMEKTETGVFYDGKNWYPILINPTYPPIVDVNDDERNDERNDESETSSSSTERERGLMGYQYESFASFRNNTKEPLLTSRDRIFDRYFAGDLQQAIDKGFMSMEDKQILIPTNNATSLKSVCLAGAMMYVGSDHGAVFKYQPQDNNKVSVLFQTDLKNVNVIKKMSDGSLIVGMDNTLYFLTIGKDGAV